MFINILKREPPVLSLFLEIVSFKISIFSILMSVFGFVLIISFGRGDFNYIHAIDHLTKDSVVVTIEG